MKALQNEEKLLRQPGNCAEKSFGSEIKSPITTNFLYVDAPRLEMLPFVPESAKRVLDVGCHLGAFGKALKNRRDVEVWGVEPNSHASAVAAQHLDRVLNNFFTEDIALPDEYFDVIVFNDVLEHMADPWMAIKIARTKLVEGGCIIASLPNLRYIDNLLHLIKDRDFQYEPAGIRDKTHLRFFTKKSAPRLFENSGFQVSQIEGINEDWWRPSLIRRIAFLLFNHFLEDTRYVQFAIVAKKVT